MRKRVVEKIRSRTSVNGCKLARKTSRSRDRSLREKKVQPATVTSISCLYDPAGETERERNRVVKRGRFFISSDLATGYNRFDLPIRQAESSVEG